MISNKISFLLFPGHERKSEWLEIQSAFDFGKQQD